VSSVIESFRYFVSLSTPFSAAYKKFPTKAQALEYLGTGISRSSAPYTKATKDRDSILEKQQSDRPRRETSPATATAESLAKEEGFDVSSEGFLVVYCDGSSLGNGKKGAKAGLGVFWGVHGESERR
jgi:ribonuclease HI